MNHALRLAHYTQSCDAGSLSLSIYLSIYLSIPTHPSATGDALLGFLERTAVAAGVAQLFVLSTNTMQWFLERDFDEVQLSDLPPERQKLYNPQRNSKIYSKVLESSRRIDAEELFWSAGLGLP